MNEIDKNIGCVFCGAEIRFIEKCEKCGRSLNLKDISALEFLCILWIMKNASKHYNLSNTDIIFAGA